jgi:hypothetical protein
MFRILDWIMIKQELEEILGFLQKERGCHRLHPLCGS